MFNHFIQILQDRLLGALPGTEAQNKMSPNVRLTASTPPDTTTTRESSVLILLYIKDNEFYIPFIQRPKYNGAHSAQVSLPGGKIEPQDRDLRDTALRETWEEIGVKPDSVQIIGSLTSLYIPNSNFNVTPYIGYVAECPTFVPDKFEVENIIEATLSQLIAPETIQSFIKKINEHLIEAPYFNIQGYKIWGATAMIISELKELISSLGITPPIPSNSCNAQNDQVSP